jgi:hypothetical protein
MADGRRRRPAKAPSDDSGGLGLPDRTIGDLDSFDRNAGGPYAVAGLHFYRELDCLIDLAYGISFDFFDRPHLYRAVRGPISDIIAELRSRYGYQEQFLARDQRHQIFAGVFGLEDAPGGQLTGIPPATEHSFGVLRDQLLAAAAAFAERVFSTSEDMLRAAVRIMHVYLRDYLQDVNGSSVQWSRNAGLPAITQGRCYQILRDPQIAARFGVAVPPVADWPFKVDANGSTLVEQISSTLMQGGGEPISRGVFNDKQQLALRGAEALATVIDYQGEADAASIDLLITRCYIWYAARGRVLQLPVSFSSPPQVTPAAARSVVALAPAESNRSLFGASRDVIPSRIS